MKHFLTAVLLCFAVGCVHKASSKTSDIATSSDCENVYQHIIAIVVNDQIDDNRHMTQLEIDWVKEETNQEYIQSGGRDRFMASCQNSMTISQIECTLHTNHVDELHSCVTLIH